MDASFSVVVEVKRWTFCADVDLTGSRLCFVSPNVFGLARSLLVFSGSGQVCVYEDYLLSSPPGRAGWGILEEEHR